ncbi:helix-turn-helix domain-containing protein [Streptomyces sp. NPDC047081]|uniref:helix-turn-helix domain-containing protein n=1 Tax=Streptomyces sp. NPDC047081 TaxID=3154706 RepID=UPI0034099FA0
MKTLWSTEAYAVGERAEAIRETIQGQVVPVRIALPERPEDVFCDVSLMDVGRIQLSTVRANPATVERTPRLASADWEPCLFISVQRAGTSGVVQDGRAVTVQPGTLALYDTRRPYTLLFDSGVDTHFFRVPIAELGLPDAVVGDVTARPLGADDPVASVAWSYFSSLAASSTLHVGPVPDQLAATTLEMVRAVIASACDVHVAERAAREATLGTRIVEYLRRHLAEPDLTPSSVAKAHHISVRQLYTVLAREGVSPGEWIRRHRLEGARGDLARQSAGGDTIAAVARRWGFLDASRFGRLFKETYGMTPREFRARSHTR